MGPLIVPRQVEVELEASGGLLDGAGEGAGLLSGEELGRWVGDAAPAASSVLLHAADADPLELLHRDFLATLADPQHAAAHAWQALAGGDSGCEEDAFESLREAAESMDEQPGLYGLIELPQPIDALLDSWDGGIGTPDVLAADTIGGSVLHLFAPPSMHAHAPSYDDADLLRQLAGDSIPALTRRQHHDIALDSSADSLHFPDKAGTP